MNEIEISIDCNLEHLPVYSSKEAAGADLRAAISETITIMPGARMLIPSGVKVAIPSGFEIQVRPRSGLALKHGIALVNSPGTIDSDYRGEIGVILLNTGKESFVVEPGMRIAQIVVAPVFQARFVQENELVTTTRGEGGFGHTGSN